MMVRIPRPLISLVAIFGRYEFLHMKRLLDGWSSHVYFIRVNLFLSGYIDPVVVSCTRSYNYVEQLFGIKY